MSKIATLILASLISASAQSSLAETYRVTSPNPPGETNADATQFLADSVSQATEGEVSFDVFLGGALIPAKSTLKGIADGVAHSGFHFPGYTPSELPLTNALSGFGFVERDPVVLSAAFADWLVHDPSAIEEYRDVGVVPIGATSTPPYPAICNTSKPVSSLEDLQGLKMRLPGGLMSKLAMDLGMVPVSLPSVEIYQALQTKQIDCAGILAAWLNVDNSLDEVSNSVTLLDWAPVFNSPLQLYNIAFWKGLTDDQRSIVFESAARAQARAQARFVSDNQTALNEAEAKGHVIVEPDETIKSAVSQWVENGVGDMASLARNTYNVEDPAALFASFEPYIEKWRELVANMQDKTDPEELVDLYMDNIYNDLSPSTYGMK